MAIVYLYVRQKLKRRLNAFFRLLIILSICVITVYLFPKVGSFQYEYQKVCPGDTKPLTAPFDFPIHKTEDELQEEREKISTGTKSDFYLKYEYGRSANR